MTHKKLENIDREHLEVVGGKTKPQEELHVKVEPVEQDVLIIVTRAFGPTGANLVGLTDVEFDGYPAVTVGVRVNGQEGLVHLSPFHGDRRKVAFGEIEDGARCELFCPVTRAPLPRLVDGDAEGRPGYYALYLTPELSRGEMVLLSDIWNDYTSRIIDNNELISEWMAGRHQS